MTPARIALAFVIAGIAAIAVHAAQANRQAPTRPHRDYEQQPLLLQEPLPHLMPQDNARRTPAQTLDDFHDAAAKADFARYFSHWTARSVFLGTDATERWTGEEFKTFAKPHFDRGAGWTYHPRNRTITQTDDRTAFFDELLDNDKLGVCRGSGALRFEEGAWKILQYNLSIPIPNDKAAEVVKLIRPD